MRLKLGLNLAFITGLTMGISAAAAQAYFRVQPPVAYGICLLGQPRDLTSWVINNLFGTDWPIHGAFIVFPSLLVIGIFIGSSLAAYRNKESKIRPGPVRNRFFAFMFGFLVVNFGLLWGSCPIRTAILASYGIVTAFIVLAAIIIGVLLACLYVRSRVRKETYQ